MNDYIIRATAAEDCIRIFTATTKNLVQKAHDAHNTSNVATAALGRLLTGGAIMGSMLKNETDVMTLQIDGAGPIKGITVTVGIEVADKTTDGIDTKEDKDSSDNAGNTEGAIPTAGTVAVKGYCKNPSVELPLKENGKLEQSRRNQQNR